MFKRKRVQKENPNMSYFFGGTAIGMAAGLLAGKLFSNTFSENAQHFEPALLANKNMNKYSQDDNIHNPYFHKNIPHSRTRSKSASRYEDKNFTQQSVCAISFNKFDDNLQNNINNPNSQKVCYDNKNGTSYNISMEDNAKCNISIEVFSENSGEEKRINNKFEQEDMKGEFSYIAQYESNASAKDKDLLETMNYESTNNFNREKISKHTGFHENIELTDTFNALSINFSEANTSYNNLRDIESSMISSNMLPSYVDNISNMATCGDTMHFTDEKENNDFDFTSVEEFYETDLISSTKRNNLGDT